MNVTMPLNRCEKTVSPYGILISLLTMALLAALLCLLVPTPRPAYAATKTYKIIYKLNGGSHPKKQVKKIKEGKTLKVSKIKKPVRTGYTFKGWYTNKKLTKKAKVVKGASKKSKRTLYAKWKAKTYTITYATNGGTMPASHTRTYKVSQKVTLATPTRAGYSFIGWYGDAALTKPIDAIAKGSTGNVTLYARWQERFFIAHRGYHVGIPQNSIEAHRAAAERGFVHVETDVRFTSDGVPVLAHDATLRVWETVPSTDASDDDHAGDATPTGGSEPNEAAPANDAWDDLEPETRVEPVDTVREDGYLEVVFADGFAEILEDSDGGCVQSGMEEEPRKAAPGDGDGTGAERVASTWKISEHTYQELLDAELVEDANHPSGPDGSSIATFEQFLKVCSERGLSPRIDVKAGDQASIAGLFDLVRRYGLLGSTSWCTGSVTLLSYVANCDAAAPLGFYMVPITRSKLAKIKQVASLGNPLVTHTSLAALTPEVISLCKAERVPLGVYGVSDDSYAAKVDPYIYELTIDGLAGDRVPATF